MIFNSTEFVIFFLVVFSLYWYLNKKNLKLQNLLLLISGYVFYAWSDWRLLSYLVAASVINFFLGIAIEKAGNEKRRKLLLYIGLAQGIGGLLFFKYFNFFITSFQQFFYLVKVNLNLSTLNIIIPLGISFFTFRTISYLLDVNKGKINATKNWVVFFIYVSFFPTILSGPIDKAKNFIPQLEKDRQFDYDKAVEAIKQIVWGLFKKVVIADSLADMIDIVFGGYENTKAYTLIVAAIAYAFQMYADFSGYSDMAIGIAKLLGFEVTPNFNYPYFAENIADFWRRWHMSLTSWLTEYVFTPLSILFRDFGKLGLILAIVINFIICGFWHGANWTFIFWGLLNGCYFIPLIIKGTFNKRKKVVKNKTLPTGRQFLNMLATFMLVTITLVIFRSNTLKDGLKYIRQIVVSSIRTPMQYLHAPPHAWVFFYIIPVIIIDWHFKSSSRFLSFGKKYLDRIFYLILGLFVFFYIGQETRFIYFKF